MLPATAPERSSGTATVAQRAAAGSPGGQAAGAAPAGAARASPSSTTMTIAARRMACPTTGAPARISAA
jgi:hypothetical protein